MSEEQRVRTEAGWIGVEISKSRVRTPGKAGYGLYRVRPKPRREAEASWTPYAFTLEEIAGEVRDAINAGAPSGPGDVVLCDEQSAGDRYIYRIPTRWMSGYAGRRDLGAGGQVARLADIPVGEGSTVRSRQRASNAAFQAEHLERRAYGLRERHAAKLQRNGQKPECGSC